MGPLIGYLHPFFVHFPVALVLAAAAAEILYVSRRKPGYGDAARFMVVAAAWLSLPTMLTGFVAASGASFTPEQEAAFSVHRIAGIVTPCAVFLAAGMAYSARRTGQIWELMLYRVLLALAVVAVVVAGVEGGEIVHGSMP